MMSRNWEEDLKNAQVYVNVSQTYECFDLMLPKMVFNRVNHYDSLIRTPSLNVTRIFKNTMDFPEINSSQGTRFLNVTQKSILDVNEQGSGTMEARRPNPAGGCAATADRIPFHANQSFMFWIQNTETGLILFFGMFS